MSATRKKRVLVIDGQLFQSYTFHRGMGKYSLALLEGLQGMLGMYDRKVLLFDAKNTYLTDLDKKRIRAVAKDFEFEYIQFLDVDSGYERAARKNQENIDAYIQESIPDAQVDFFILSLFEDRAVSVFPTVCAKRYVLLYDLVPLRFFDPYLRIESVASNYLSRFSVLLAADHFFTISGSVATDATLHLGIPKRRITPIYGAAIERKKLQPKALTELIGKKIILLPSGDDYRKNNQAAVDAFEQFNKKHNNKYTLVVTSSFTDITKNDLLSRTNKLVFVGNVSEVELAWLYANAELILFPSQSEGLGLPVLEAIEFGKKIVCSDIQSFREINQEDLFFCDPYNVTDIIRAMTVAIMADKPDAASYAKVLRRYAWKRTAQSTAKIFLLNNDPEPTITKLKVAVFAPRPDGFSGIGKVVQDQHYELSRSADVTYFFEEGITDRARTTEIRKNYLKYAALCRDPWTYSPKDFSSFDKTIYHIGNGEYHTVTLVKALAMPDLVVLHDTRIKGLFGVVRDQGFISTERYDAESAIDQAVGPVHGEFLTSLLSKQNRVITHSHYSQQAAREAIVEDFGVAEVVTTNLPVTQAYFTDDRTPDGTICVAMAGLMTESKGIDLAIGLTRLSIGDLKLKVKIFGFSMLPEEVVRTLRKNTSIELIQSPTDTRYLYDLSRSDIMLNFRKPYHGETSYSTLEGLRFGKSVIVNNMGWFAELPDALVYKLDTSDTIMDTIHKLASAEYHDKNASNKRKRYIEEKHNISDYISVLLGRKGDK